MPLEIKTGGLYGISELVMAGYFSRRLREFKYNQDMIQYKRGSEVLLASRESDRLRIVMRFDPETMERAEFYKEGKMTIEIKVSGLYSVSELRSVGYEPKGIRHFGESELIERYGTNEYRLYKKGTETLLVTKDSGKLRVCFRFDISKGKSPEIYRPSKK